DTTIMQMPLAVAIDGSEYLPIVQAGTNKRMPTGYLINGGSVQSDQAANTVYAGPASGAPAVPTFRALVSDDFSGVILNVAQGGTGLSSLTEYAVVIGGT